MSIRHAFLLPTSNEPTSYGSGNKRRYATSAAFKYTNSGVGGNWAINMPYQFTQYADIRVPGRGQTLESADDNGQGRFYSEAFDDTAQLIHMSFGHPQFSSWASFFVNFYDRNAALLANTGRVNDGWYEIGLVTGFIVSLPLQPFILGIQGLSRVYNFLTRQQPSKWYYFKAGMHAYWSAVNVIATELAIGEKIIPRAFNEMTTELNDVGQTVTPEVWEEIRRIYPDVVRPMEQDSNGRLVGGGIDIMALANRTQRISMAAQRAEIALREQAQNLTEMNQKLEDFYRTRDPKDEVSDPNLDSNTLSSYKYFQEFVALDRPDPNSDSMTFSFNEWKDLNIEKIYNFMTAEQRDGSQFVTFAVNHIGEVSESFSNSTRESDIAQTINTKVAQGRTLAFDTMGGNIIPGLGSAIDTIQSAIAGLLDSVNAGGLAVLTGTAFLDVPNIWESSSASLPRADYTISLPCPYGNKLSRYFSLQVPLAMLLPAVLPQSAGPSSYTSPMLCQIYHQGRCQKQLAMVESLTVRRGKGNVGWNAENQALGLEVSISVVDLSKILHMPLKGGFRPSSSMTANLATGAAMAGLDSVSPGAAATGALFMDAGNIFSEQSLFSDYMAVLSHQSVSENYYIGKRLNLNVTRSMQHFRNWRSPSNFFSWVLNGDSARTISALAQTTGRF